MVVVVEQYDALPDAFKNTVLQAVEHSVGGVIEATPVQQKSRQAVTADGIIQQTVYRHFRPEQKHAVHGYNGQYAQNDIAVLRTVFSGNPNHLSNQQEHDHNDHEIGEKQMHLVERAHLIAVSGEGCVPADVVNGNFVDGIEEKDNNFKRGVEYAQADQVLSELCESALGKIHDEHKKIEQHHIDGYKIDAGHDGH